MPLFLTFLFLPLVSLAQWSEDAHMATYHIKNPQELNEFNRSLMLPLDWGSPFGGHSHTHKLFQDQSKNVTIYCKENGPCLIQIKKISQSSDVIIFDDNLVTTASLYALKDTTQLFKTLKVKSIIHGDHELKVLTNNTLNYSISCLRPLSNEAEIACQVHIFKPQSRYELK